MKTITWNNKFPKTAVGEAFSEEVMLGIRDYICATYNVGALEAGETALKLHYLTDIIRSVVAVELEGSRKLVKTSA